MTPTPRFVAAVLAVCVLTTALPALASHIFIPVQGRLTGPGGGAVADGPYVVTFSLYPSADAQVAVFKEIHINIPVVGGGFSAVLGSVDAQNPLTSAMFTNQGEPLWLGVKVESDPELPRSEIGVVPYAVRAMSADTLTGGITGDKLAPGTVPAGALGFAYAGSETKGGPASGLACTGCITSQHIAPGTLAAESIAYSQGGQSTSVGAVLDSLSAVVQTKPGQLGVATSPALGCALDVASGAGGLCIDGAPAMVVRTAANQAAMDALAVPGQIVLRIDEGAFYVRTPTAWRKMLLEAVCGDGSVDLPEECDDGQNNADAPNACRTSCKLPACGDGIIDNGEDCDDGNLANGDGCSTTCKKCGDGVCQVGEGEDFANCPQDCPKPLGTASDNPGASCKAIYDDGQTTNGVYWVQWGNMPAAIQVYCKQDTDFGTGTTGGWMLYCGTGKDSITGGTCASGNPTWDKMKDVDYLTHASYSPQGDWWMSIEFDTKVTSTPTACNARMRVKSDLNGWGKTDSQWMNNLQYSSPCGGNGGCWWGHQSGCNSGGIHLRSNGNGYTSVDTMANGWVQITHGGGLGAFGGYTGGKHTSFGAGGTASDPAQWEGYVR